MTQGIYKQPVMVNPSLHAKHRIAPAKDSAFAAGINAVFIAGVEMGDACKEYPVVFAETPEGTLPLAMLGLREKDNLFLTAQNQWDAKYVPAYIRRYPFVLANIAGLSEEKQLGVCVDESFEGWNTQTGEVLFEADGTQTAYLKNALEFLSRFQGEHRRTAVFGETLKKLALLKPMDAQARLNDGRSFTVSGFQVVDHEKLRNLTDEQLLGLQRSGELYWIHAHLISLSNMKVLVEKMSAAQSQPA